MPAHLHLVPTPLMADLAPELVDPYVYSLAVAFLLSPDLSDAEDVLRRVLETAVAERGLDVDIVLAKCASYLREAGVIP
jgi:hypothetical protein